MDDSNPLSVASMVKKADDRLYRTLMFAPLIARLVYAMCVAVVGITGFVLKTQWEISAIERDMATKANMALEREDTLNRIKNNAETSERNAKIVDQIYKDFYKREPPPR